jgi:hypothetical protein
MIGLIVQCFVIYSGKGTMQLISSIVGDLFTLLIDAITSWIRAYGYAGVFLAMLIEPFFLQFQVK